MSQQNCTCKFNIIGSESVCILNTEWTETNVKLLLLHDNQAWRGEFQITEDDDLTELLDQLSLSIEKYREETRKALTTHGGAETFAYSLENDKFTWKKYVSTKMAVKFGYVTLSKVPAFEVFEKIVDNTLQLNIDVTEKLVQIENRKEILEKDNLLLKTKLDELIEKKKEMETTLYSQFLHVLNEKKKKIVDLKNKLEPAERENKPENQQSDSDPFGSETEKDSEEEKESLPSKALKKEESLEIDSEYKSILTLPKSRRGGKRGSRADLSGLGRQAKNGNKSKPQEAEDLPILRRGGRKSKESCVIGKMKDDKERNCSEEDAFTFPKRPKRTINNAFLTKPSTSKIIYDSDDDDDETFFDKTQKVETFLDKTQKVETFLDNTQKVETFLDKTQKVETFLDNTQKVETFLDKTQKVDSDSDRTLSQIDVVEDEVEKIKIEEAEENDIDMKSSGENKGKNVLGKRGNTPNGKTEPAKKTSYKGFSSSTIDILNQLI